MIGAGVLAFLVGTALFGQQVQRFAGFPLDDAWIHQIVGGNLARYGVPSFAPGDAPAGSTSTLWPAVVALNRLLFSAVEPHLFLFVFNAAMLALSFAAIATLAIEDRLPAAEAACLIILPALTGNFLWLAASGMEHSLFVALVLLAAAVWTSPRLSPRTSTALAGTALALAILTRIEAIAFVPIFLVGRWLIDGRRRPFAAVSTLAWFLGPILVATLLVLANNLWTSGTALPVTMQGRRWLYFGLNAHPDLGGLLAEWEIRIHRWYFRFVDETSGSSAVAVARLVVNLGLLFGLISLWRLKAWRTIFVLTLALATLAMYAMVLPAGGHGGRYQALLMPFIMPVFAIGLIAVGRWAGGRLGLPPRPLDWSAGVIVAAVAAVSINVMVKWAHLTGEAIRHINDTEVRMADWICSHVPKDDTVASFDIGGIGRFAEHRIVDLGGLTDPAFAPNLYAGSVAAYLERHSIVWLVLPTDPDRDDADPASFVARLGLRDSGALAKEKVITFESTPQLWSAPFLATELSTRAQTLYKLHWTSL